MISILTEPAYSGSIWCKELLKSLTDRLRQKRIPFCEIFESIENNGDGVFIIASDYNWIKSTGRNKADTYMQSGRADSRVRLQLCLLGYKRLYEIPDKRA